MRPLPTWEEPQPSPTDQVGWDKRNKDLIEYKEDVARWVNELLDNPHVQAVMNIPADEPIFVLRAQDIFAPEAIDLWLSVAQRSVSTEKFLKAATLYQQILEWQNVQPTRAKIPD